MRGGKRGFGAGAGMVLVCPGTQEVWADVVAQLGPDVWSASAIMVLEVVEDTTPGSY